MSLGFDKMIPVTMEEILDLQEGLREKLGYMDAGLAFMHVCMWLGSIIESAEFYGSDSLEGAMKRVNYNIRRGYDLAREARKCPGCGKVH